MEKIKIWLLSLLVLAAFSGVAQNHDISVGVENNEYAWVGYSYRGHWVARVSNSFFFDEASSQYVRLSGGYWHSVGGFDLAGMVQYGQNYGNDYHTIGALLSAGFGWRFLNPQVAIMPYYDSVLDYHTCYSAGLGFRVTKEVEIGGYATNIPEFRTVEDKVKLYAKFRVGRLEVKPEFCFPFEKGKIRSRFLFGFSYSFPPF